MENLCFNCGSTTEGISGMWYKTAFSSCTVSLATDSERFRYHLEFILTLIKHQPFRFLLLTNKENILNLCDTVALFHTFIVTVFSDSACCGLELVRGSNSYSGTTPTVRIQGDCWPPYGEIVTRYPLCGATKLKVFVDRVEGQSSLTLGLISPNERFVQFLFIH